MFPFAIRLGPLWENFLYEQKSYNAYQTQLKVTWSLRKQPKCGPSASESPERRPMSSTTGLHQKLHIKDRKKNAQVSRMIESDSHE